MSSQPVLAPPVPRRPIVIGPSPRLLDKVQLFESSAHLIDRDGLWAVLASAIGTRRATSVLSVNVHWMQLCAKDPGVAELDRGFDLRLVDGAPVRRLAEVTAARPVTKHSGADLVPELCARSARHGWRLFFLGAAPGVAAAAAERAQQQYPGCVIAGTAAPSRDDVLDMDASREICAQINEADADVVLVAFGQPMQERWITRHRDDLEAPIRFGIGGSLDLLADRLPRAPEWMQQHGLEWTWRVAREPGRLWRRYLVDDLPMGLSVMAASAYRKRRPVSRTPEPVRVISLLDEPRRGAARVDQLR